MLKKLNKSNQGFTIIEVLIVLAIAALILLIVFLAVPALQRNSRNTQRKNDVAAVLGAMNEYSNNANGAAIDCTDNYDLALENANLGFYDAGDVTCADDPADNDTTITTAVVVPGAKCTDDGAGNTEDASSRQVAVMYQVEAGGEPQYTCQDE